METVHFSESGEDILVPAIFCLGKNYARHAAEMDSQVPETPIVFMKPSTAIVHNGARIGLPVITNDLHHETEIFFVLGKEGRNVRKGDARSYIAAMGVGLDLTLRDVQSKLRKDGNPWLISKGFDGSAPISDAVPVKDVNFEELEISLTVNGKERQRGRYSSTIFKIEDVIVFISRLFTLERGDLIFTGTPEGVSRLERGDRLHAELVNYVSLDVEID